MLVHQPLSHTHQVFTGQFKHHFIIFCIKEDVFMEYLPRMCGTMAGTIHGSVEEVNAWVLVLKGQTI